MSIKSSHYLGHVLLCLWACLAGFLISLAGCADEPVQRDYPKVRTLEVTNITENGATFVAEVIKEGTVPVTEHGFTWSLSTPNATSDERVFLGTFNGAGRFETEIRTALGEGITYEVCAFVKAGDYTVYGDKVKFLSLGSGAPEIIDFMPKTAGWGDTITISGKQFSHRDFTNKVFIEDQECAAFGSSDTLLKCVVPTSAIKPLNSLSVSIMGNVATAGSKLTFIAPEVYGFSPVAGFWRDTVTFTGRYLNFFGQMITDGMILNDNQLCKVVRRNEHSVSFIIPGQLNKLSSMVSLSYRTFRFSFPGNFTLLPTETDSIRPATGTWGTKVTLYGKFNYMSERNKVLFGDKVAAIVYTSCDSLVVKVPDNLNEYVSTVSYASEPFSGDFDESFALKAPEIHDFEPKSGYSGNLVEIRGSYFRKDLLTVEIGGRPAIIRSVNDTIITCHVPGDVYGDCTVSVSSLGHTEVASGLFTAANHTITSISPLNITYGDTVTVTGTNFRSGLTLTIGTDPISLVSLSSEKMQFVVPLWMRYDHHIVTARYVYSTAPYTFTSSFTASDQLQLEDFTIANLSPLSGSAGDLLVISGTKFGNVSVTFGTAIAQVTAASRTELTVKVPVISAGEHDIKVTIGGRTHICPQKYTHISPWRRLNDLPFLYENACVLNLGEEVFVVTGGYSGGCLKEIYRFNPSTSDFTKAPGSYYSSVLDPIPCTLNGKGYILGSTSSVVGGGFEVFNPDSLTLRILPTFPGRGGINRCLVADDTVIYAGCGRLAQAAWSYWYYDFWKYSPATNSWTQLADCPYRVAFTNQIFIDGRLLFAGFLSPGSPMYLLEYHPLTNSWSQTVLSTPEYSYQFLADFKNGAKVSVINDGKWYIGFGDWYQTNQDNAYERTNPDINNRFYRFDMSDNSYKVINNVAVSPRTFALSFAYGGKIYIGGNQIYHYYDFWVYDPQLDQ